MPTSNPENFPSIAQKLDASNIVALEWQNWPLQRDGFRLKAVLVLMLVGIIWLLLLISLPTITGFVLGAALLLVLFPYYLPTRYILDQRGITVKSGSVARRTRGWQEFVRYETKANGYLLSPFSQTETQNRLEPFRALYLPFPADPAARSLLNAILKSHFTDL